MLMSDLLSNAVIGCGGELQPIRKGHVGRVGRVCNLGGA